MKRVISAILALTFVMSALFGCAYSEEDINPSFSSDAPDSSSQDIVSMTEYPSFLNQPNYTESALAEIVSRVDESHENSSETTSSEPTSSETTSSEPTSSETTSSETTSSETTSSETTSSETISSEVPSEPEIEKPEYKPQNPSFLKAVWISFLEFQSFAGSSESSFINKISSYFSTAKSMGLNAVIVQVRPHGDSFYESSYYPWSKSISGTMGKSLNYDPLAIMVDEAHAMGLSIHAWINPYRTMTDTEMALIDSYYPVKSWYESSNRSNYMVKPSNDGRWWLKPGNTEVQDLIVNGAVEIVNNYNVDGIHLDDYFYGGDLSYYGDSQSTARKNTTALIKKLYNSIKAADGSVMFGVSPSGAFRAADSRPHSDLTYLSTDLQLWCQNSGYIDYVMPQLYWDYDHKIQPFTMTLEKWENFVTSDSVELYIGVAPSGLPASSIESQIVDVENSWRSNGYCLYRYDYIHNLSLN